MRATEFLDWINREDLKLGRRPKATDYTHLMLTTRVKRARYLYQCKLRGIEPIK